MLYNVKPEYFVLFPANCVNAHSDDAKCREWALDGECAINPAWMPINCASDCHTCKNNGSLPDGGMKTTRGVVVTRPPVVTTPPPTTPTPSMHRSDLNISFSLCKYIKEIYLAAGITKVSLLNRKHSTKYVLQCI